VAVNKFLKSVLQIKGFPLNKGAGLSSYVFIGGRRGLEMGQKNVI